MDFNRNLDFLHIFIINLNSFWAKQYSFVCRNDMYSVHICTLDKLKILPIAKSKNWYSFISFVNTESFYSLSLLHVLAVRHQIQTNSVAITGIQIFDTKPSNCIFRKLECIIHVICHQEYFITCLVFLRCMTKWDIFKMNIDVAFWNSISGPD